MTKIEDTGIKSIIECMNLDQNDCILYLGGRIDDDNLYPPKYVKYLNRKIKRLNPKKIICHSHWYAWKYYDAGVLDESTKIDMIICHAGHMQKNTIEPIDKSRYENGNHHYVKQLVDKNINIFFAFYRHDRGVFECQTKWFNECGKDYDIEKRIKYYTYSRSYCPSQLVDVDLGHGDHRRNSTDGFGVIINLLNEGLKNLNIAGFTAFGSDEDTSHFSLYKSKSNKLNDKKYFQLKTSEDQKAEADILKRLVENKTIYNVENYSKLTSYLKEDKYKE